MVQSPQRYKSFHSDFFFGLCFLSASEFLSSGNDICIPATHFPRGKISHSIADHPVSLPVYQSLQIPHYSPLVITLAIYTCKDQWHNEQQTCLISFICLPPKCIRCIICLQVSLNQSQESEHGIGNIWRGMVQRPHFWWQPEKAAMYVTAHCPSSPALSWHGAAMCCWSAECY